MKAIQMPHTVEYKNNPTVCCVILPWKDGDLVLVRRGLPDGYGKLALPGGFQEFGEEMHDAAAREVKEETGITINPADLRLVNGQTDHYGHNVLFFIHEGDLDFSQTFTPDAETLGVEIVSSPVETAYPLHTREVERFFSFLKIERMFGGRP